MNVIIVEDERSAIDNMLALLQEIDPDIKVLACLKSIEESLLWINNNPSPELAFFDIQLADGSSFEIFEKTVVKFPVVFTTAYSEYTLKAFKVNSIDYILKPIRKKDLEFAIQKYKSLSETFTTSNSEFLNTLKLLSKQLSPQYKRTILVKTYDGFIPVLASDIAYFFIENEIIYCITFGKRKFTIPEKLEAIEKQLSPEDFFRANRQFILSKKSIVEASNYFGGRLSVKLNPSINKQLLISKSQTKPFKKWLEDND
jgi:two-component system LytT family response regulator